MVASGYWCYDNRVHRYTRIHRGECVFCNHGEGFQTRREDVAGEWLGPFASYATARDTAARTGREVSACKVCRPSA
jgi:F-type H+-transporting ATPase subunit beta